MQMLLKGRNNGYVVTEKGVQEMNFYTSTTDNKRKQLVQMSCEMLSSGALRRDIKVLV